MKIRSILLLIVVFAVFVNAQTGSINNTIGTGGSFIVKDGANSYLRVDQSSGNTHFLKNMELGTDSTSSSTSGVITKGGIPFIHNYKAPNTSGFNTFIGLRSGNFTLSGTLFEASFNTAVGYQSLSSLTNGNYNSAFGNKSLSSNMSGSSNSAFGVWSLLTNSNGSYNSAFGANSLSFNNGSYNSAFGFNTLQLNILGAHNSAFGSNSLNNNIGSYNSAFGSYALYFNYDGGENSAFGLQSLYLNYSGFENSAFGSYSLYSNNSGYQNSAYGNRALYSNIIGIENSAFGYEALTNTISNYNSAFGNKSLKSNSIGEANSAFGIGSLLNNTSGSNNTAMGNIAGSGVSTGNNNIAVGFDAQVPNGTVSNQVRIGNTSISYAGIQVAWSITSDRRWKENINPSDLGLDFVSKLNPVAYTRKNDETQKIEYGLIAQELEQVLKEEGGVNSAMLTIDGDGRYELRYNDLFAPMIKAIQELKQKNDELVLFNQELAEQNVALRNEVEEFKLTISEQIEDKIKSLLTQVSESEDSGLNVALEK